MTRLVLGPVSAPGVILKSVLMLVAVVSAYSTAAFPQQVQRAVDAYNRGLELQDHGQNDAALKAYDEAVRLNPKMLDAYNNRANLKLAAGDRQGAVDDLSKVIELSTQHALGHYNRGCIYLEMEEHDKAIADFTRAIDIFNGLTQQYDLRAHSMSHNNRGNALFAKGETKAAMTDYDRSIAILKKNPEALINRGVAHHHNGNYSAAVADYSMVLEWAPESRLALMNRAMSYEEINVDAAIADYTKVIGLDPKNAVAYARRGLCHLTKKRKTEAAADLTLALQLDSKLKAEYSESLTEALKK